MDEILGLLSEEDKGFLIYALNAANKGGPVATRENLRFFTKDAVRSALDAAENMLNDYGRALSAHIRAEL